MSGGKYLVLAELWTGFIESHSLDSDECRKTKCHDDAIVSCRTLLGLGLNFGVAVDG